MERSHTHVFVGREEAVDASTRTLCRIALADARLGGVPFERRFRATCPECRDRATGIERMRAHQFESTAGAL